MRTCLPAFVMSALLTLSSACGVQSTDVTGEMTDGSLKPLRKATVERVDKGIRITSAGDTFMGAAINHSFDFSSHKALRFTLINESDMPCYFAVKLTSDMQKGRWKEAKDGCIQEFLELGANQTKTYEVPFPAPLSHPEVNEKFNLMRNTPYSHLTGLCSYNVDLSRINEISFTFSRCPKGMSVLIKDIEAVSGKPRVADKMLSVPSEEFFPFIDKYGQFRYADWKRKIHKDSDLSGELKYEIKDLEKNPGPSDRSIYGGWTAGPRLEATGRFRVAKHDGKWWMVDPEGWLFWSHGVVRVTPSTAITPLDGRSFYFDELPEQGSEFERFYHTHDALLKPYYTTRGIDSTYDFSSANCYRKYGEDYMADFADMAHRRLRSWGMNTIANSSDKDICLMDRTPYTDRLEVRSRPLEGSGGSWWPFMDPYDPSFVESVKSQLVARQKEVNDPWLLGLFVDNEIHWGDVRHLARCAVKAAPDQAAKAEFMTFLKKKYKTISKLNKVWGTDFSSWDAFMENRNDVPKGANPDLGAFNKRIIRKYYSNIRETFDEYAPGVLYLGCRFSVSNKDVISIGEEYCDVISFNIYSHNLEDFIFPEYDKPIIIGEFHFGARDRGMFHSGQVETTDQAARGRAYEEYVMSALKNPKVIGTHWHQFSDQAATGRFDGENFQVGLTDCCDTPYYETLSHVRKVGYGMYKIRSGK